MSRVPLYLALAAAPLQPARPHYLVLFVTSRCNARCRMCFNWEALERNGEGDLALAELQKIAEHWPGLIQLTLSGGEPFLREDLVEVVEAFVRRAGARQVSIPSNAILTERVVSFTSEILRRFPGLPLNLNLSVDAIGDEHDRIRQVPGAFAAAMKTAQGLRALRRKYPNLRLGATVVLMKQNHDRILETLVHLEQAFPWDRLQVELARGRTREPDAAQAPLECYQEAARWLREHGPASGSLLGSLHHRLAGRMREVLIETKGGNRMVVPCRAGQELLVVEADGTVRPCEVLHTLDPEGLREQGLADLSLGNLRENDYRITEILRSPRAEKIRAGIVRRRCHCSYECALYAGLVFNPRQWSWMIKA
jgi:MoaA/NifB/PqqE/SkfB family radical SAM enzyme